MTLEEITRGAVSGGRKMIVPFFTAGYPDAEATLRFVAAAGEAGCQVVELGIPFSDPIADGPAIQESSQVALAGGMTLTGVLELADRARRASGVAVVLMGYYNPILQMGPERFARHAAEAGVAGVIIPDVPLEESGQISETLRERGQTLVRLVARTSPVGRIQRIAGQANGFLYLVSVEGVTGSGFARAEDLQAFVGRVRGTTDLPLYVGFGIADRQRAQEAARAADGVIIGSALVRIIKAADGGSDAAANVREFLVGIDQGIN